MTVLVVNTAEDVVSENDGKLSLREAVAQAAGSGKHMEIRFDPGAFDGHIPLELTHTLEIPGGTNITIDGTLDWPDAKAFIQSTVDGQNLLTVSAGATVVLRDFQLGRQFGGIVPVTGGPGGEGSNGATGENGESFGELPSGYGTGESGTDAGDGADAPLDAGTGTLAVGGVINRGTLILERVDFIGLGAVGGNGGNGGSGGQGGQGGYGSNAAEDSLETGGGGDGGDGGDGARGGDGGGAVAAIYNAGNLTVRDVTFSALSAEGGDGSGGGDGGSGGKGGDFGSGGPDGPPGGDGGDGGNGANGGNGGNAVGAIWNVGSIRFDSIQTHIDGVALTHGLGGAAGSGGLAGVGGGQKGGVGMPHPRDGANGAPGSDGLNGTDGITSNFLGANPELGNAFIIDANRYVFSDRQDADHTLNFIISLLGEQSGLQTVKWTMEPGKGITGADFVGGQMFTGGTLDFSDDDAFYFSLGIQADTRKEGIETFTITLSDPTGAELGWSRSIEIAITDGPVSGKAPTDINISSKSIAENSAAKKVIGNFSTKDGDKGDRFDYELIDSADGRFALKGNKLVVADGSLLDFEQAKSHKVVVRSTDLFGNAIDETIKIKVKDIGKENVIGNDGDNRLVGGAGKDRFDGKGGNDILTGGNGADKFLFTSTLDAETNVDHITDFKPRTDQIRLDRNVFEGLAKGALSSDAFHLGATAEDESDRILYDAATGTLYFDRDGANADFDPIAFAVLDNHPAKLGAGDFFIS